MVELTRRTRGHLVTLIQGGFQSDYLATLGLNTNEHPWPETQRIGKWNKPQTCPQLLLIRWMPISISVTRHAFNWPYYGIGIRRFTFKNCTYEIFDAIRIQVRIAPSLPVKMLSINLPKFTSKENSGGSSVYSYSRIASTERAQVQSVAYILTRLQYPS